MRLDKEFWEKKYMENETGWDIGHVSTPIKEYIDQIENKDVKILIPGAGNAYEAEYLHHNSFTNVHVIDISQVAIDNFLKRVQNFPLEYIHCQNFFNHSGHYDLVLEQTFLCALSPNLRSQYVQKMAELLMPGGKLAGLLFGVPMYAERPPYGGSLEDYVELFSSSFDIKTMETSYNSITPRKGSELFFIMKKSEIK